MFKAWMNTSNVGRMTSRWLEAIIEVGGGCEESAWDAGCEIELEPEPLPRANIPFDVVALKFFRIESPRQVCSEENLCERPSRK
jgi:hypothetical protein